jgi:hypothetical protein
VGSVTWSLMLAAMDVACRGSASEQDVELGWKENDHCSLASILCGATSVVPSCCRMVLVAC